MQQLSNRAESHLSSQVEMENLGKGAWVNYGYNTSPPPLQRNISTLYNPQPAYHSPMDNMAKLNMPNPYPAEVKEERLQEEKKSSGCCSCIKGIWGTTLTEDTKGNREQFVKTTLRELVVYIVFLVDICILTYGMTSPNTYYYTKVMTKLFVNTASGSAVSFANIGSMDDFWAYAQGPLIDGLYWTKWYNNRPLQPQIPSHLYYENILLGVPRVRQLRVMNNTCKVATEFSGQINSCFDSYSDVKEDNKDIGVINGTAWRYHSESAMNGSSYWGVLTTYGGGGYYQDLANNRTGSASLLADLYSNMWLNHGTRAVFVDFSTYNANINLFCVIRLVVEFLPSGGAVTSYQIRTVKLIRYITTWDYVVLGFEVLFCVFILYYIVEEILEIRIHKLSYFKSIWNILDVVIIMLAIVAIIFNVFRTVKVDNLLEQTLRDPNIYADFEFLAFWQTQYNNMNAVNLFFAWIKIFKYISFNKTMTQLSSTLARCAADIFGFAIMFFIVFFAYAQLGYLIFGSQVETFSIFHKCIFTQFRIILGDFDYDSIDQANRVLGPIYFFTYVFFVFFVLMNMFLAIINDTYCEVKEELASQKDDLQITDIFKQSFMNLKRKKEKISDVQKALQSGSSALEFRDFREKLKEMGHADQEITAAFAKYDRDGNQILDQVEQERMKRELEEKRDALCKELNSLGRNYGTKDNEQNQGSSRVTQEEFQTLARQVRQLEYSVATIMSNMDSVMEKLDLPPKANNKEATGRLVAAKKDEERPASGGNVMVNLRRGAGEELPFSSPNAVGNSRPLANAGPNRLYPDVGWPKVNQHSPSNRH